LHPVVTPHCVEVTSSATACGEKHQTSSTAREHCMVKGRVAKIWPKSVKIPPAET